MNMKKMLIVALISTLALAGPAAQGNRQLLDRDTFMEMESVSATSISPDVRKIVFTREWTDPGSTIRDSGSTIRDSGSAIKD